MGCSNIYNVPQPSFSWTRAKTFNGTEFSPCLATTIPRLTIVYYTGLQTLIFCAFDSAMCVIHSLPKVLENTRSASVFDPTANCCLQKAPVVGVGLHIPLTSMQFEGRVYSLGFRRPSLMLTEGSKLLGVFERERSILSRIVLVHELNRLQLCVCFTACQHVVQLIPFHTFFIQSRERLVNE